MYRESLAIRRRLLGNEYSDTANSLNDLANLMADQGDYAAAEPLYREALAIRRKVLGNEHRDVAMSLNNLALLRQEKGDYEGALLYQLQGNHEAAEPLLLVAGDSIPWACIRVGTYVSGDSGNSNFLIYTSLYTSHRESDRYHREGG